MKIIPYKKQDTIPSGSYVKVGSISKGIVTFRIEKLTQSSSFLAIKIKGLFFNRNPIMFLVYLIM